MCGQTQMHSWNFMNLAARFLIRRSSVATASEQGVYSLASAAGSKHRRLNVRNSCLWSAAITIGILASAFQIASAKPNIVILVGDDMGYADIGVHGCKDIPTPNIDSLAGEAAAEMSTAERSAGAWPSVARAA